MAAIGTLIDGKYEIIAEIGRGGMSTVYLAIDRRLNKQWAIKEAKKKPGSESAVFELTPIAEANLLKTLNHENIVRIVDIIEQGGLIYIVEDYVEGMSLAKEVERGPSSPEDVVEWGVQLCSVFEYLHSRTPAIIYRDMKPANIQLDPDRKKVKLLDFGIAKTYKAQNVGDTYNLGTRGYAAPEQFDTNRQSDARTDIFSLGVTLRALLMGKTPNQAEFYDDIRKYNPMVSDGMIKVISKATDQNPDKRYQTATEFKNALLHYHDSDDAVINFKKKKLRSFRALMASAISFLLVGVLLLPISAVVQSGSYNKYLSEGNYAKCIEINPGKYEAYIKKLQMSNSSDDLSKSRDNFNEKNRIANIRNKSEQRIVCLDVIAFSYAAAEPGKQGNLMGTTDTQSLGEFFRVLSGNSNVTFEDKERTNISDQLASETNTYAAFGKMGLFYCTAYDKFREDGGLAAKDKEDILKGLTAIKTYIDNHKTEWKNEELTRTVRDAEDTAFEDRISENYTTLFDLAESTHNQLLMDFRKEFINYSKYGSRTEDLHKDAEYTKWVGLIIEDGKTTETAKDTVANPIVNYDSKQN